MSISAGLWTALTAVLLLCVGALILKQWNVEGSMFDHCLRDGHEDYVCYAMIYGGKRK